MLIQANSRIFDLWLWRWETFLFCARQQSCHRMSKWTQTTQVKQSLHRFFGGLLSMKGTGVKRTFIKEHFSCFQIGLRLTPPA